MEKKPKIATVAKEKIKPRKFLFLSEEIVEKTANKAINNVIMAVPIRLPPSSSML